MRRVVAIFSLVVAWLCANGAVWDAMQIAAWGRMFAAYSQTMAFSQALRETLDPSKPCEMCVGIAKARDEGHKDLPTREQQAAAKFVLISHTVDRPVFSNDPGNWLEHSMLPGPARTDPVPLRPPRV